MIRLFTLASVVSACATSHHRNTATTIPIDVRSHNRNEVDVYLLCGDRDAEWLGSVPSKESRGFEVSAQRGRCLRGLNFVLMSRKGNHGYVVGPLRPSPGGSISLVIEKYAGLSSAAAY